MRAVITGGLGYLGTSIARRFLDAKIEVVLVDNLRFGQGPLVFPLLQHPQVKFWQADLACITKSSLPLFLPPCDVLVPLHCLVGAPLCQQYPDEAKEVIIDSLQNLLEYYDGTCAYSPVILFPNTNSGIGSCEGVATEDTPRNSVSLYGRLKDQAEDIIRQTYPGHVIFRLATVFGIGNSLRPRLDLLVNSLTIEALTTGKIRVFNPEYNRNYCHVDDIADAFLHAALNYNSRKMLGNVFNLGNDDLNCTKLVLANQIANYTGCRVEVVEGEDPDKRDYKVSSARLRTAGFKATRGIEQAVRELSLYRDVVGDEFLKSPMLRNY